MYPHVNILSDLSGHADLEWHGYPCWSDAVVTTTQGGNMMDLTEVDHWHPDFEFIYYTQGGNTAFINGSTVQIGEGQGLLINSRRIHHYKMPKEELRFILLRIHPGIFIQETNAGLEYYERKFGLNAPDYILFDQAVEWQKQVLDGIVAIHESINDITSRPLRAISVISQVLDIIGEHIPDSEVDNKHARDYSDFYKISEYIRQNFNEKITIDDLEHCCHTSRTRVFQLFNKFAHMTPQDYITQYRVAYGSQLLQNTTLPISNIANTCGFSTPSHFTNIFHKEKGMTPREFRNSLK